MPAIIANDVVMVTLEALLGTRPVATVLHVKADRPILAPVGDSEGIATRVMKAWQDHIVADCTNNYAFLGARYMDLDSDTGDSGFVPFDPAKPHTGTGSANAATPQVTYNIKKVPAGGAPRGLRGRIFLPGVAEGAVDNAGFLASTEVTELDTDFAAFLAAANADYTGASDQSAKLCIVHFPRNVDGDIIGAGTGYVISSFQTQPKVATQRRRLRS